MSEDVLGKLKGLCSELHARIEATTDYKTLVAVERALKDIEALTAVAGAAAAPEDAIRDTVAEAGPEATVEAETSEVTADSEEAAVNEVSSTEAELVDAAPMGTADEAPAAEAAADAATDADIAEIPPEDRALVAELVAPAGEATAVTHGTAAR